ncbi:MAG: GerMN domain-containing protein [Actinobacteria bacterium]|nr:GerMN domain-containing protein [Actinomycetota bacterium]
MTRRTLAIVIALLAAVVAAGCGVPLDDSPRAINQTTTSTTTTAPISNVGGVVVLYFVDEDGGLVGRESNVERQAGVQDAVTTLLATEPGKPLATRIPSGTRLNEDLVIDGDLVQVDLTGEMDEVSGEAQKLAFAQIVFTILEFPAYSRVTFLIEGEVVAAPTDGENREIVRAADYDPPINPG